MIFVVGRKGEKMKDPIERRDVLNLFDSVSQYMGNWLIQYIEDGISSITSAQPERKTGTWIAVDYFADGKQAYREWECSACGCVVEDEKPTWNFCPMCGADMRGDNNDE